MNYQVYLELYSKKLRVTVDAISANDAIKQVKAALIIHKVVKVDEDRGRDIGDDLTVEMLKDLFNLK